jgi:hypothetical protein
LTATVLGDELSPSATSLTRLHNFRIILKKVWAVAKIKSLPQVENKKDTVCALW